LSDDDREAADELIIEMVEAERYEEALGLVQSNSRRERTATFIRLSARHSGHDRVLIALNKARNALLSETVEDKELRLSMLSQLDRAIRQEADLAEYERALTEDPEDSSVWHSKGLTLHKLGRLQETLEAFDRALALDPDDSAIWLRRGLTLDRLGRHEEALEAFNRAIAIDSHNSGQWFQKGQALENMGDRDAALEAYDRALAIDPSSVLAANARASLSERMVSLKSTRLISQARSKLAWWSKWLFRTKK